jgi:hypothetical protein
MTMAVPVAGGDAKPFPAADVSATEARWSRDGRRVAYVAGGQLWVADANGANAKQLTNLTGGASGPVWAPTGEWVAFVSSVYPDCADESCNAAREKAKGDVIALALILGGALGNIVDRVRLGYVVDYADLHIGDFRPFMIFNVADACITLGVLLLVARALLLGEKTATTDGQPSTD